MNPVLDIQLHLIRHAHAGDPTKWRGPDDLRPLTEKGREQSERLGIFLARAGFEPDAILSSPKVRAMETARLVGAALGVRVDIVAELGGPLDFETVAAILRTARTPRRPVLVGHDPDFSMLAAELAGVDDLPVRKAALVRIDTTLPMQPGEGVLRWLVPPELLEPQQWLDR
jgi:phosphohistidine phosphatase